MIRLKQNPNCKVKTTQLQSVIIFILIVFAVIGGYAIYKGAVVVSVKDGVPGIEAASYKDSKPVQEVKNVLNKIRDLFK